MRREHDKKVCILGLASVLHLPLEVVPVELQLGLDQVFKALLNLLLAYKDQRAGTWCLMLSHCAVLPDLARISDYGCMCRGC